MMQVFDNSTETKSAKGSRKKSCWHQCHGLYVIEKAEDDRTFDPIQLEKSVPREHIQ